MIPDKVASASTRKATAATAKTTPSTKKKSSPTKIAQAAPTKTPTTPSAAPTQKSYRVRSGDTLYRIAVDHGVTVAEILAINSLGGVGIHPGDLLKIPPKK